MPPFPRAATGGARRRFLRPLFYTTAIGGTSYILYKCFSNANSDRSSSTYNLAVSNAQATYGPPSHDHKHILQSFAPIPTRAEQIKRLKAASLNDPNSTYDLVVIGGGATGSGIALDAASRGLKVALLEKDDFSSGTSSKSTKLVHGGVRYLEKAVRELDYNQYLLVKEALKERAVFLKTAPHLSMSLPIMLPIYGTWWDYWKVPYYWVGTKAYDWLAGKENLESSYFLSAGKALEAFPMLKKDGLAGALVYYDGSHNDSRMNVAIALTAAMYGATVVNHIEATELVKDKVTGRITGVKVEDLLSEEKGRATKRGILGGGENTNGKGGEGEWVVQAKGVINATGPFTDSIRKLDDPSATEIVAPSSGVHIVLPGYYSPQRMGLIDPSTSDGRVIFFLPWQGNTIAGTTDAPTEITQHPLPRKEEINWILSEVRRYLAPDINVRRGDVLAAWSGIRPLVRDPNAKNTKSLVRNHLINISPSGLLTIAGGKWTTYRQMAEDAVDEAIKEFNLTPGSSNSNFQRSLIPRDPLALPITGKCETTNIQLLGAHGYSKTLFINLIQHFGLETSIAQHLAGAYGDRSYIVALLSSPTSLRFPVCGVRLSPLYPFIDGEVRYAVRHEYAQTAVDIIARRTRLAFLNAQAALETLPKVIDIMGEELQWSKERKDREWKEAVLFLRSMGLPEKRMGVSRRDVESGKVREWGKKEEYEKYERFDGPIQEAVKESEKQLQGE